MIVDRRINFQPDERHAKNACQRLIQINRHFASPRNGNEGFKAFILASASVKPAVLEFTRRDKEHAGSKDGSLMIVLSVYLSLYCTTQVKHVDPLLNAIRVVESNGRHDVVGDGGRAIGPYQIHYRYWKDSGVKGRWQQCRDREYAENVMRAYWKRYCPDAMKNGNWQKLARVHNGGPKGHVRKSTLDYWQKVRRTLECRPPRKAVG